MKMTGLTDQMINNRRLMTAVSEWTKLDPQNRMDKINNHARNLSKKSAQVNIDLND